MNEPKRCPFCGEKPHSEEEGTVMCSNDDCLMSVYGVLVPVCNWNTRPIEDVLNQRIEELTHKNEVLMDSYLESETIDDKGKLVGSLEYFKKRITDLEAENKALRLIAGSHSMSELRRNRIMTGWRRGDTLKNEVKHE